MDIFHAIRDATKIGAKETAFHNVSKHLLEMQTSKESQSQDSLYEVLYIGKVVVSNKKTQPSFIDDAVEKFKQHEMLRELQLREKQRHNSDQSVQSLPGSLDQMPKPKENELRLRNVEQLTNRSDDSLSSNNSDVNTSKCTVDTTSVVAPLSDSAGIDVGSEACVTNSDESLVESPFEHEDLGPPSSSADNLHRSLLISHTQSKKNRTMLLQISKTEVSLISPDRKRTSLKRNFKDISFCSQVKSVERSTLIIRISYFNISVYM